ADRLVGQVRAEGGGPVVLDVPDRHPARVEADGHVIEPAQAPLPLRDQARGERPSAIPRDLQLDRPELGLHRLRRAPVAGVGVLRRLAGALLVAQVAGQLGLQTPLERCLDQRGHEPAVTGQLDLASVDLLEQGIQLPGGLQLLDQILARGPIVMLLLLVRHGHDCSVPLGTAYTDHLTRPPLRITYEAGPTGFGLARFLAEAGHAVQVAAPSKLLRPAGERVKTDRRDAVLLARLARNDDITPVRIPTLGEESVRDLVRSRDDARRDLMSARHRLGKLLLRRGYAFPGKTTWGREHERWLRAVRREELTTCGVGTVTAFDD